MPAWLDPFFGGGFIIESDGAALTKRGVLNLIGPGFTVADDPTVRPARTNVTLDLSALGTTAATPNTLALRGASAECSFGALTASSAAIGDTSISDALADGITTSHVVFSGNGGATVACDFAGLSLSCPAELDVTSSAGNVVVTAHGSVSIQAGTSGDVTLTYKAGANTLIGSNGGDLNIGDNSATSQNFNVAAGASFFFDCNAAPVFVVSELGTWTNKGISRQHRVTETFASTMTIDLSAGKIHEVTLTANLTALTLSNMVDGGEYVLAFIQGTGGGFTLSVPANMRTAGSSLVLSTGSGKRDVVTFYSDGTNLYERGRSMNE